MAEVSKPAQPVAKAAVVGQPYGVESIEGLLDFGVEALKNYKTIKPEDKLMQKVLAFMPAVMKLAGALDKMKNLGPEFKDLDDKELEALSAKYISQFGIEGKTGVYVKEGMNILVSGYKIFKAK